MSYALMLFEELFASQLSVPSSPVHPIKCTTVQTNKKNQNGKRRRNMAKDIEKGEEEG